MRKWLLVFGLSQAALGWAALWAQPAAPSWPSLQSQLDRDHVKPGSALDHLIRGNQDFFRLRPEEAVDEHLPPWLKVLWRKAHPKVDPFAVGYPLILYEFHEWLVRHQDLQPTTPPVVDPKNAILTHGNNIRISGAQPSVRDESDVRVNPLNPLQIVGASNNVAFGPQAQFFSADGGLTWGQSFLPIVGNDVFHGDPAVDWTSDGVAWAATLGINLHGSPSGGPAIEVRVYRSTNGGATWTLDDTVSGGQLETDKEAMWVDHSSTSPFKDDIYVVWTHSSDIWFNRRTSSGWSTVFQVSGTETIGPTMGADVKTNAAGEVFAFWPSGVNRRIILNKSTDGGAHFGTPVIIANTFIGTGFTQHFGIPAQNRRKLIISVSAGANKTATKNLVYASWIDLTGAPGCQSFADAPFDNVSSTCKIRVWFSRSTNGGATWSTPSMINNQSSLNDQFNQRLLVDEATGAMAITYYDTVGDPGRLKTDVWYQSSFDDGLTWTAPFKVTTAQTDETASRADSIQYGEYNGLSGLNGDYFTSWTDRRNGGNEEIWGAALRDSNPGFTVFSSDFQSSLSGLGLTGLWHLTNACQAANTGHTLPTALYFGIDGQCSYETGTVVTGTATLPPIGLKNLAAPIQLNLKYFLGTEHHNGVDLATIEISANGGPFQVIAGNQPPGGATTLTDASTGWQSASADLSGFAGTIASLRFKFDSVDQFVNNFPGFLVDDISIAAAGCQAAVNLELQDQSINSTQVHEACDTVFAGSDLTVEPSGNLTVHGGKRVVLRSGFRVKSGATFKAAVP